MHPQVFRALCLRQSALFPLALAIPPRMNSGETSLTLLLFPALTSNFSPSVSLRAPSPP